MCRPVTPIVVTGFRPAFASIEAPVVPTADGGCRMKYMLLIYSDEKAWEESARVQCYNDSATYARELSKSGKYLAASPLHPVATATSVRVREGKRLVTDGPFAETREQLGGYYIIDANDIDDAVEIAGKIPGARLGTGEIRRILEIDGLPEAEDKS
jgi:hypothetical protein